MTFGQALEKVKSGEKIFRHGWNGKGMFVVYQKGYPAGIPCNIQTLMLGVFTKETFLNVNHIFRSRHQMEVMLCGIRVMLTFLPKIGNIFIKIKPSLSLILRQKRVGLSFK